MKRIIFLIGSICLSLCAPAQQHAWKEMESFHELVGAVLHPVEMGNLRPVKEKSAALLAGAMQWQASAIPPDCNYPALKTDLVDLVKHCKDLDEAVRMKRSNDQLKKLAIGIHNQYHRMADAVKKA
ncbi:MAG: hypothetical protein P4L51_28810 [Puia sp.]|nr:hypothetical protein [Puia sp.]